MEEKNFVRVEKEAMIRLILLAYKKGFNDARELLNRIQIDSMFSKEDIKGLVDKLSPEND